VRCYRLDSVTPTTQPDPAPRTQRPGGRSARVREAVYTAVGQLVAAGHRDNLTIPQVAERAQVNPTSIYRRWHTIDALCAEVAVAALTQGEALPDTGTVADDLQAWATIIAEDIETPARTSYLRALIAARSGMLNTCPCWEQRLVQAELITERARRRGENPPTATQVVDHVIAPLYHHAVFGLPGGADYAARLVSDLLAIGR
jgi:AcrR family transcriptional regulator